MNRALRVSSRTANHHHVADRKTLKCCEPYRYSNVEMLAFEKFYQDGRFISHQYLKISLDTLSSMTCAGKFTVDASKRST